MEYWAIKCATAWLKLENIIVSERIIFYDSIYMKYSE